eukprot:8501330-Pyramimonas_sp.AAC.1
MGLAGGAELETSQTQPCHPCHETALGRHHCLSRGRHGRRRRPRQVRGTGSSYQPSCNRPHRPPLAQAGAQRPTQRHLVPVPAAQLQEADGPAQQPDHPPSHWGC